MNVDARSFITAIVMSVSETPPTTPETTPTKPSGQRKPSGKSTKILQRQLQKHLGISSMGGAGRLYNKSVKNRKRF